MLVIGIGANTAINAAPAIISASDKNTTDKSQKELPPWKRQPEDLRAAVEANKLALRLITAVFAAEERIQKGQARWVAEDDLLRQIQFIDSLFELAV